MLPAWNICLKDLRITFRDRSAMIWIFGMPVMFILIFGTIFGNRRQQANSANPMTVTIANLDSGVHGNEIISTLRQMGLTVIEEKGGEEAVRKQVSSGKQAFGVVIPADFTPRLEQAVAAGGNEMTPARMQLLVDPAQATMTPMARGSVFAATQRVVGPLYREARMRSIPPEYRAYAEQMMGGSGGAGAPRSAVDLDVSNPGDTSGTRNAMKSATAGDIMVPGYAVLFAFFLANGVAISLITERQEGTMRRLLCAPIARHQILFGKLLARGFLGVLQVSMLFLIGKFWLQLGSGSSPFGLVLIALTTIFAATGLGLLIASFGKTIEQIAAMTSAAMFLMGAISGCMMPRMFLPPVMQTLSLITPHAWALNAYQDLLLRRTSLLSTMPNIGVVLLFGLTFYGVALMRFRYE